MNTFNAAPEPMGELVTLSAGIRRHLLRLVHHYYAQPSRFVAEAETYLRSRIPHLANGFRAGQLLAFFRTARATLKDTVLPPRIGGTLPPPILMQSHGATADVLPSASFPQTVRAANWLRERIAYTPAEFAQLDYNAQRAGFTVARIATENTVAKIRNTLADLQGQNVSVRDFQNLMRDTLDVSPLSDSQLETIYRTHTGRAATTAKMGILNHPLVRDEFPYLLYVATHDSRVRPEHLAMESLGLDDTAVYRADDPIWNQFLPPWAWNCRCEVIPLSVEDAAEYGVREAIEWVKTGRPPARPEFVKPRPFSIPNGWIPTARAASSWAAI